MSDSPTDSNAPKSDDHPFDPTPITTLPPGEPATPMALSVGGLSLLLVVALFLVLGGNNEDSQADDKAGKVVPAAAVATPKPIKLQAPTPPANAKNPQRQAIVDALKQMRRRKRPKNNRIQGGK